MTQRATVRRAKNVSGVSRQGPYRIAVGTQGPAGKSAGAITINATGVFAGRSAHDAAAANFGYLSTDGDGGSITDAVVFVKLSATSGDWSSALLIRGEAGTNGTNGIDSGIIWLFASSVTMGAPGAGNIRFNNATWASVTALAISYNSAESGNPDSSAYVKTWDDSTTTAHRGLLIIKKKSAPQNYVIYDVTAALVDNSTWLQATVAYVGGNGSFTAADILGIEFLRTGNAGAGFGDMLAANNLSDVANVTTARSNLYAAPFDALAYNGMQVNGSMLVSQINVTAAVSAGGVVDSWGINHAGTMVLSAQQSTDAPPGYSNSIKISVATAQASMTASDFAVIYTQIEGYRVARLAFGGASAQSVSIGFWVKAHRTGTYSGVLGSDGLARSYPFNFTIISSDTWEYKTLTIAGDTAGTWLKTTGIGCYLVFAMASGTTNAGPANAWASVIYQAATGTINGVAATSDYMAITGVVILPGIELPSSTRAPFIARPFDQELTMCKRYYEKTYDIGVIPGTASALGGALMGVAVSTTQIATHWSFKVSKRIAPTITPYSYNGTINKWCNISNSDIAVTMPWGPGENDFARLDGSGLTVGAGYFGHLIADARF